MNKVYFLKDFKRLGKVAEELLLPFYPPNSEILVKIHLGEVGNQTALQPQDVKPLVEIFKKNKISLVFFDTPVLYQSVRRNVLSYRLFAQGKGWGKLGKIKIASRFQTFKAKDFQVEIAQDLLKAQNVLVVSHVKGHPLSGFGGAIKNLGMGGVSRKTKELEHNLGRPVFVDKCQGCGICAEVCPFKAFKMVNGQAQFENEACFGCSLCVIKCPHQTLAPRKALFDDLLAQAAALVIKNLPQRTFYLNFLKNITKFCDCFHHPGEKIAPDLGILFSQNPLAIEQASLDLLNQKAGGNLFEKVNRKDPYLQLKFAAGYSKGVVKYQLESI